MVACRMVDELKEHTPVLIEEAVHSLLQSKEGVYIDSTFGRGSHSSAILKELSTDGRLIAFDKDPEAYAYAKTHFAKDPRFTIYHQSFADMFETLSPLRGQISGILFDLGISSPQVDNPSRGFSFSREGTLDMRMDTTSGIDAKTWLRNIKETELADILWRYGEEKFSRRIAKAICLARETEEIQTTTQLADIIKKAIPKKQTDKHPATRSFQAIRIAINQELEDLEKGLTQSLEMLKIGGRLAVISFHSLEDRIVKQFIYQHEKGKPIPRHLPIKDRKDESLRLKSIGKAIKPSQAEIDSNSRARSAILRIAEKIL